MNSYIFILCPPYSGSTVIWKLISTSKTVSALPREGQYLPEVKAIMRKDPWNVKVILPWVEIKNVWDGYWDLDKPLLVEKSPPHIIRTGEIVQHFSPVYFIIMVRNPYALCEGLMRRNRWTAEKAAEFAVCCMKEQAKNVGKLDNFLCFTYEEMVGNPKRISEEIQSFIPQIGVLNYTQKFSIHSINGTVKRGIVNLNKKKIDNLSYKNLIRINSVLKRNAEVMEYWNYGYYEPSLKHHFFRYLCTRTGFLLSTPWVLVRRFVNFSIRRITSH